MAPLTALSHALAELSTLAKMETHTERFRRWHAFTLQTLTALLGEDAPVTKQFAAIRFTLVLPASVAEQEAAWREGRQDAYLLLLSLRFQPFLGGSPSDSVSGQYPAAQQVPSAEKGTGD